MAGDVTVDGVDADETDGVVAAISVEGDVASTAGLKAGDFGTFAATGSVDTTVVMPSAQNIEGTGEVNISAANSLTKVAQTLVVDAGRNVDTRVQTLFGKFYEVSVSGSGAAGIYALQGTYDANTAAELRTVRRIGSDTVAGRSNANIGYGTANLGKFTLADSRVAIRNLVVDGNVGSVELANRNVSNLWVDGDADEINASTISRAFIGGDLGTMTARTVRNTRVIGATNDLMVGGNVINSYFFGTVADADYNRAIRSVINEA